jgi:excisionase family DNA binding protein
MATSDVLTLSPHEAAARLGIGRGTMYRLPKSGRLPAIRVGRRPHYRIPLTVLEEALAYPERLSIGSTDDSPRS